MLLGGGSSCQSCGCKPDACPDCRHYNYETIYSTATVTVTIDGSSVPVWSDVSIPSPTWLSVSAPGVIQSFCFEAANSPKVVRFHAVFNGNASSNSNISGGFEDIDIDGCNSTRASVVIHANLHNTTLSFNTSLRLTANYDVPVNCTDIGGAGTLESAWVQVDSITLSEDCLIEYYDFLNQLDISVSFSWDPCECPP